MNVLISSAAAKRPLLEGFRAALGALGGGRAIAADSDPAVAAADFADDFVCQPRDGSEDFAERWLAICRDHRVNLLVPTRDGELPALAALKDRLARQGTTVLVPNAGTLALCLDKIAFYEFCRRQQFPVARRVHNPVAADLPLFARARNGAGSRAAGAIDRVEQLPVAGDDVLLQPRCDLPEYSIDVLFSQSGQPLQAVVRERIEVEGGESVVTAVRDLPELASLALRLGSALGLTGPAVIQCFYDGEQGPLLIECNPRFGGASMVSVHAGLASCERLLLELRGDRRRAFARRTITCGAPVDRRRPPPGVFL